MAEGEPAFSPAKRIVGLVTIAPSPALGIAKSVAKAVVLTKAAFAGIALLPIVACMAYAHLETFFYIGLIIIVLIYFFRISREIIIGFTVINFSVLHLILYLCTLEILPMIVLAKILTGNMIL